MFLDCKICQTETYHINEYFNILKCLLHKSSYSIGGFLRPKDVF